MNNRALIFIQEVLKSDENIAIFEKNDQIIMPSASVPAPAPIQTVETLTLKAPNKTCSRRLVYQFEVLSGRPEQLTDELTVLSLIQKTTANPNLTRIQK